MGEGAAGDGGGGVAVGPGVGNVVEGALPIDGGAESGFEVDVLVVMEEEKKGVWVEAVAVVGLEAERED